MYFFYLKFQPISCFVAILSHHRCVISCETILFYFLSDYASTTEVSIVIIVSFIVVVVTVLDVSVVRVDRIAVVDVVTDTGTDSDTDTDTNADTDIDTDTDTVIAFDQHLAIVDIAVVNVEYISVFRECAADLPEAIRVTKRITDRVARIDTLSKTRFRVSLVCDAVTSLVVYRSDGCWNTERSPFG